MKTSLHIKIIAGILCIAILLLGVLGCADRSYTPAPNITLPTPKATFTPANGGTLRMPMPANADLHDPFAVSTEEMMTMFSLIYEGLVRIDESNNIVPALAENWSCDASGRIWTLNLRKDAKWHTQSESVTAHDVKYSYDKIVGMNDPSYYSYNISKIESVEAIDEYTVRITMRSKGLLSLLCLTFPIVKNETQLTGIPIGTGAYTVESLNDDKVILRANENWWKQRPYIDNIEFIARDSNETALASFAVGQFNVVPTSAITAGRYRQDGVATVMDIMTQDMEVLLVNHSNAMLKNVKVRQAIAYIIDRGRIISNACMNRAQACDVPIAPDSWIYDSKSKIYDHSLSKAAALLEEAGYTDSDGDGVLETVNGGYDVQALRLLVSESADGTRLNAANAIAEQLTAAGIKTEVTSAVYSLSDGGAFLSKLNAGEFDIAMTGFNMTRDYDISQYIMESGSRNYGGYSNSSLVKLAEDMYTAADEPALRDAASKLQLSFAHELPFIVLYFRLNSIVYASEVNGVTAAREPDILRNIEKWYINTGMD